MMATISQGTGGVRGIGSGAQRWKPLLEMLDRALAKATEENRVEVVALTSLPGIGKSTALIRHIWDLAKAGKAPGKVVYIVFSDTEASLIRTWLLQSGGVVKDDMGDGKVRSDNPFTLCSLRECFQVLQEKAWDANRTVIVDVNWYPTVRDEIAFGYLLSWTRGLKAAVAKGNDVHVAILLLMSTFESERTVIPFERMLTTVIAFDLTDWRYPTPKAEALEVGWKEKVGDIVQGVLDEGGRVVLGSHIWQDWPGIQSGRLDPDLVDDVPCTYVPAEDRLVTEQRSIEKARVLALHPLVPYSTRVEQMRLFLTPGVVEGCHILYPELMQVVVDDRELEWCERLRQYSWVLKSMGGGSPEANQIRFLGPAIGDAPRSTSGPSRSLARPGIEK